MQQLQIGELLRLHKPALVPYDGTRAIALAHGTSNHTAAADLVEAIALQLLQAHPLDKAKLALYEPTPSPQFSHLKRLFAQTERRVGHQLLSADAYHQHITRLTDLAHQRFTLLAASQLPDIHTYNAQAARQETLEFLLVSAVLTTHNHERDLLALQTLCQQGPRVGIVPLLLRGAAELEEDRLASARKPLQSFWQAVAPQCFGFDWRGPQAVPLNQPIELWRLFERFGVRVGLPVTYCGTLVDDLASSVVKSVDASPHADFLRVPIGREGVQTHFFGMGDASRVYHVMVGGTNRSGKSAMVDNVILQSCETFGPEALRLWLLDFKGVGYAVYEGLAHVEALYLNREGVAPLLSIFDRFYALVDERRALLARANAVRIEDYNRTAARPLSRCLMIVDEAQNLFVNKEISGHARRLLNYIATEGASFGLHLILITQTYQNMDLDATVKENVRLRIGFQLASDMACRALMGRDNFAMKNLPRFAAVYNSEFGEDEHNRVFHSQALHREDLEARVEQLKTRYPLAPQPDNATQPVEASSPPAAIPPPEPGYRLFGRLRDR